MKIKGKSQSGKAMTRRTFLNKAAAGSALAAMGPVAGIFAGKPAKGNRISANEAKARFHMIGHAHIDPVWLWPWTEGLPVVMSTFRSALDRMNENPDFTFISSSAQFYQWVSENDPEMLTRIRERVKEGRWNVVGGWWVEPDVNIPSGEAMVRQGLYGQLTIQRLLGTKATVAFNPDSFGHTGTLPQILRQQGMENYIFMRPGIREKTLPADLFWWIGPDGSRVLTYRIPISYNDGGSVKNRIEQTMAQLKDQPMKSYMAYYGAGDHGGGATKENILSIEEIRKDPSAPTVFYSTPERYFREIRDIKDLKLPEVKDDLQHHATGCYTAESAIKKGNRTSEAALVTAEKLAAVGSVAWGAAYPASEFTRAWQKVLFLQFHDSLAGTSVPEHSQTAAQGYGYALETAHRAAYLAVQKLEWKVAAEDPASQYLLVFNPHAWEVDNTIEYDFNWGTMHKSSRVEDEKGNPLMHQWSAGTTETGSRKKLLTRVAIPAMGYRQIRLLDGESPVWKTSATAENNTLENEFLKIRFSPSGSIGILDKRTGKELFTGGDKGCQALIIDDPSDTWSHDIKTFDKVIGSFGDAQFSVLENGPLRAVIRSVSKYGASHLSVDWILTAGSPYLDAAVTLDWHEHLKMVKFSFPVNAESPVATYETPYGHIIRETNGYEDPGQRWIDLTGKRNGSNYGLTVINDAKYGYSVHGNDLRISVARSAVYAHHNPRVLDMKAEHIWMDQGIQTFKMKVVPHEGTWKEANAVRLSEEAVAPSLSIYQGIHGGTMPKSGSFLSVDKTNTIVSAVKLSETGEDLIIRCVETSAEPTEAVIDLGFAGRKWKGQFRPCEIKTLRLSKKTGDIREVNLLEE